MKAIRKIFTVGVASLLSTLALGFPFSSAFQRAPGRVASGLKSSSVNQKQSHLLSATMSQSDKNTLLMDESETREFCRSFLAPYGNARAFMVVARNKYADGRLRRKNLQLEKNTLNFHTLSLAQQMEEKLIRCIRRTEALASAAFYDDGNDVLIDTDWMACYVSAYPLDVDDACEAFMALVLEGRIEKRHALVKQIGKPVQKEFLDPALLEPVSKLESMLQQSPSLRHRLLKLDVDTKDPVLIGSLQFAMRDCKCVLAVETRGGFHVVVERRGKAMQELWKFTRDVNKNLSNAEQWVTFEEHGGGLVAIPGTKQGGFSVRLITDKWREAMGSSEGRAFGC